MLSDEEKISLNRMKLFARSSDLSVVTAKDMNIVVTLVEKQSKEIEKLKQNIHLKEVYVLKTNDYIKGTNIEDELCNKKWEDKIKAILEEYKYTEIGDSEKIIEFYKKMESLLEKE